MRDRKSRERRAQARMRHVRNLTTLIILAAMVLLLYAVRH